MVSLSLLFVLTLSKDDSLPEPRRGVAKVELRGMAGSNPPQGIGWTVSSH